MDCSPLCGMIAGTELAASYDETISTIGLDIAKSVFQTHGVDAAGKVVVRWRLARGRALIFFESLPRCLDGTEACRSSRHWAGELKALSHNVRLLPTQYVKPI